MHNLTMKDIVEAQNKRRKGEPYPMAETMEEIDYLIARVRALEHDLSTVHTDRVPEQYKAADERPEGDKELLEEKD
ncbi:MAG TPA: hypothetical protein PLI30_08245 [Petrimonas sp.]|nr:hypothetical protein [Petrimonas sp.]